MFLSTHKFNPFESLDRSFNQFWDDDFSDFFSALITPQQRIFSKEEQLKRNLNNLHNQENEINHYIKQYESHVEQLKKNKEQIDKQKTEITDKIAKIVEGKKKSLENDPSSITSSQKSTNKNESKIFKRVYYKNNDMEIEEQYDSSNPKNCFKVIRKQGQPPQVIKGEEQKTQLEDNKEKRESQQTPVENNGSELQDKLELLQKLTGKNTPELANFVNENKDLSIGQLFDKAQELNLA